MLQATFLTYSCLEVWTMERLSQICKLLYEDHLKEDKVEARRLWLRRFLRDQVFITDMKQMIYNVSRCHWHCSSSCCLAYNLDADCQKKKLDFTEVVQLSQELKAAVKAVDKSSVEQLKFVGAKSDSFHHQLDILYKNWQEMKIKYADSPYHLAQVLRWELRLDFLMEESNCPEMFDIRKSLEEIEVKSSQQHKKLLKS